MEQILGLQGYIELEARARKSMKMTDAVLGCMALLEELKKI